MTDQTTQDAYRPPVPDHELIKIIGRGSYGEVWLARNVMGAYRAVKVVRRDRFREARPYERELEGIRLFEPISRAHQGFVHILHIGEDPAHGAFYYVMELGDDITRGQTVHPGVYRTKTLGAAEGTAPTLPLEECIRLGLSLTEALDALHARGLVHRDIKPSNIIFVGGVPKLADIGLVTEIGEAPSFVGTEGFAAPEGPGSPQADIYSLGKVLYEISTRKDRKEFPAIPSRIERMEDWDRFMELNEVLLRACARSPAERYASARAMRADLVVLENGASVRRLRALERTLGRLKKYAAILAALAAATAGFLLTRARERTLAREILQRRIGALSAEGLRAMEAGDHLEALASYTAALQLDPGDPESEHNRRVRLAGLLHRIPKIEWVWDARAALSQALPDPFGRQILVLEHPATLHLIDARTGHPLTTTTAAQKEFWNKIAWHPDGQRFGVVNHLGAIRLWETGASAPVRVIHPPRKLYGSSLAFSPDGNHFALGTGEGFVLVGDLATGHPVKELTGPASEIRHLAYSPDGRYLAAGFTADQTARVWNVETGQAVGIPLPHPNWVQSVAFNPDGSRLVTGGDGQQTVLWDFSNGRRIPPPIDHDDVVVSAEYSADGLLLLSASMDGRLRLFDAPDLKPFRQAPQLPHAGRIMSAAFLPDAARIVVCTHEGAVTLWNLAGTALPADVFQHRSLTTGSLSRSPAFPEFPARPLAPGETVVFSRNGRYFLTTTPSPAAAHDETWRARVHEAATGLPTSPELYLTNAFSRLVLNSDGKTMLIVQDRRVERRDTGTGRPAGPSWLHPEPVAGTETSPTGDLVVTWGAHQLIAWNPRTLSATWHATIPEKIQTVEFSDGGSLLALSTTTGEFGAGSARVLRASDGSAFGFPVREADGIVSLRFSPTDDLLAVGTESRIARLWNFKTGRAVTPEMRHAQPVVRMNFSADGMRLATLTSFRVSRVWDTTTGEAISPGISVLPPVGWMGFDPSGCSLEIVSRTGDRFSWNHSPEQRSVEQIARLAAFYRPVRSGSSRYAPGEHWRDFLDLNKRSPENFQVAEDEWWHWHLARARRCLDDSLWESALFHLRKLAALNPDDPTITDQIEMVRAKIEVLQR